MVPIILLLVFAVLAPFALLSCNSPETDASNGENDGSGQNRAPSEEQTEKSEFEPVEGTDYAGYKFRVLDYDGSDKGLWQVMAICEMMAEEETGEPINDAIYKMNREVEALYNIDIGICPTAIDPGDIATKFTKAVLSGDDLFDAAFLRGSSIPGALGTKNMAYDLLSIPSLDLSKSWWDQNSAKAMSIGGKLTAVIGDINFYSAIAPIAVYVNKKIVEDNDIGDLYKMTKEGKWTWDAMYGIAKICAKDLDGDGIMTKDDQVGLFMQYFQLQAAINSAGEYMTPKNEEDIPVFSPNMEKISGIAEKVVTFYNDKDTTVAAESITGYSNQFYEFMMPKFRDNQALFFVNQLLISFELRSMEADFAILPLPKYEESQPKYGSVVASWWGTYTVMPITCTDTERTANILGAMGYYAQKYVMPAYYDKTVTGKLLRDDEAAEMMDIIMKNRVFDLAELYNWGNINGVLNTVCASNKADTIVSQLEKSENAINKAIQKTLDQLQEN